MTDEKTKKKLLGISFVISILYAFHLAIPLYSNSTFLGQYLTSGYISLIYAVAFSVTFLASTYLSKFLHRYHNYETTLLFLIINFVATIMISRTENIYIISTLFVIYIVFSTLLFSTINIFI